MVAITAAGCGSGETRDAFSTVGTLDFANRLHIPPLAKSTKDPQGVLNFDLTAEPGTSRFLPGKATPTWGYNGAFLGPTIRARRGDIVRLSVRNSTQEGTTIHWHGMRLPSVSDGGPHQPIAAGDTWTTEWKLDQPAATLWYHPHPHGKTEQQVLRGLAGMFIIDTNEPLTAALPSLYGVDDFPVIVQDRTFEEDGSLRTGSRAMTGLVGDTLLVNGTYNPYVAVTTQAIRLRLLNASSARVYNFGFSDDRKFCVIGSDGGLLHAPVTATRIQLSPGERAEVVVRFLPGESTVFRSFPQELGMGQAFNNGAGGNDVLDVLEFQAADMLSPSMPLPDVLTAGTEVHTNHAVATRDFILNGTLINGRTLDMDRIDTVVRAGSAEIWNISNIDHRAHNFHIHDMQFKILDIDGEKPAPEFAGWKDTVFLPVRTTARLALTFGSHTAPSLPYMYHCHMLWHEDQGMMGQYAIEQA
ncbi:multicopper oxidase family protein [Paenarthrobacter sp. Z7-10]|uniref:multicopper oxidase family protein n=1 Tax=Paenarthrobacter sp. Z7-10 TaxID=2787635 RepID=UPI0022A92E59|nr:multicopper oxidase domain-containing protein [Paenarthrobacter sp. Z7-10]